MTKRILHTQWRDLVGVGSVINTKHEGVSKRPTENIVELRQENDERHTFPESESPMKNPDFLKASPEENG